MGLPTSYIDMDIALANEQLRLIRQSYREGSYKVLVGAPSVLLSGLHVSESTWPHIHMSDIHYT